MLLHLVRGIGNGGELQGVVFMFKMKSFRSFLLGSILAVSLF